MKIKILVAVLFLSGLVGSACNRPNRTTNNSVSNNSHAGMNHNASNMPVNHQGMNHGAMDHSTMDHSEMQSSPGAENAPYDLQFLDTMIAHHQGALEMAKPAAAKAEHAEIKTLATNILADQEKEISEMKRWREQWFTGKPAAINMKMPGMTDSMKEMDMKKLDSSSGNEFDLEFINQMIPHHQGAVVMAKEALQKSQKEEIKKLANAVIKAQETEIKQMRDWQTAWSK
jgi:uncharacterized protein (DUF305 family)